MEIKTFRNRVGMKQEELADACGVTQCVVSAWESGKALPRADKIPLIAAALGCEIADLFGQTKKEVTM